MLFIIVMDSLLKELAAIDVGINLGITYTSSFGHVDDLRSLMPKYYVLATASINHHFCEANVLQLNMEKLDLLCLSNDQSPNDLCINLNGKQIHSSPVVRCLSTYCIHNLTPKTSIENILKVHNAYFALGSIGIHSNLLSPLIVSKYF